jgi:hypothetical protein
MLQDILYERYKEDKGPSVHLRHLSQDLANMEGGAPLKWGWLDGEVLHTCLQSVELLQQSTQRECRETGTTGSAREARKVSNTLATENTEPGKSLPPVSNMSRISSNSDWRQPSENNPSYGGQIIKMCIFLVVL